jgi:hypothetical protein
MLGEESCDSMKETLNDVSIHFAEGSSNDMPLSFLSNPPEHIGLTAGISLGLLGFESTRTPCIHIHAGERSMVFDHIGLHKVFFLLACM